MRKKEGTQYLIVLNYSSEKQKITIKTPVEDMDTAEKVQGQRAFLKIQIRNYCAMKSMGTKERDRTYWTSNKADMFCLFLFGGKNQNKPTTFAVSMEYTGFEPVASTMRMWRAPNCANTPYENYITKEQNFKYVFRRKLYCIKNNL